MLSSLRARAGCAIDGGPDHGRLLDRAYRHNVRAMATTHYFPTDQVHFTWDTGNEPVLTVADGDTVVFETRDVSDNQIGPDSDASVDRGAGLGSRLPAGGAGARRGRRARATRSCVEILDLHTQGLGLDGDPARLRAAGRRLHRARTCGSSTSRPATSRTSATTSSSRSTPFLGTMGVCPADASAQPMMPPGNFGGNLDTRQLVAGTTLYLPVHVERRAVQHRRRARLPGRRRDLRDRARGADVRQRCASASRRAVDPVRRSTARRPAR